MAAGIEIELKFVFAPEDEASIEALIAAVPHDRPPVRQHLTAVYYDTPEGELWKHGFVLRVRSVDENHFQTLKRRRFSDVQREEWETETGRAELDLDRLLDTPIASLLEKRSIRQSLEPLFEVKVDRTSHWVEAGASLIEASIDHGEILAKGKRLPLRELELELKTGALEDSFGLARALISQAPLHSCLISKAERGRGLAAGTYGQAVKGSQPCLSKRMTSRQAFQAIGLACLHDLHLNILALDAPDNAEAIHQARIAIRRMRAAMALFKPIILDPSFSKLDDELKWLGRMFGAARDMDVLAANLAQMPGFTDVPGLSLDPVNLCKANGEDSRQAAIKGLRSERGRMALLELLLWLEALESQPQLHDASEPLPTYARSRLKKRLKNLVKGAAQLADLGQKSQHKIRIKAKELRYMAEFFSHVPGVARDRKSLRRLTKYCEKIQSALGQLRDAQVLDEFLDSLAQPKNLAKTSAGSVVFFPVQSSAPMQAQTPVIESSKAPKLRKPTGKKARAGKDREKSLNAALRSYARLAALDAF